MSGTGNPETWAVGERDTVISALDRVVARLPDKVMLDFSGELYTYLEIDRLSTRMANALAAQGIAAGDTVLTMLDNNVDAVITWLAINKLCAVSVPINTALKGEFLRHQVADTGTQLVICEADYLPRMAAIGEQLTDVKRILFRVSAGKELGELPAASIAIEPLDLYRGSDDTPLAVKPQPADLACLIYTSGTTGPSKGCMISYNFMCNLARLQLRAGPASENDVTITPLPLFHMNALCVSIIASILVGARA